MPGGLSTGAGTQNVVAGTFLTSRDKGTPIAGGFLEPPIAVIGHIAGVRQSCDYETTRSPADDFLVE